jgi:hypothetical protein
MKKLIKDFCKVNEVELFKKLNVKFKDGTFYEDGLGCFKGKNDSEGVDVSLIEGVLIEDDYNKIDKVEVGGKILFVNDYRFN